MFAHAPNPSGFHGFHPFHGLVRFFGEFAEAFRGAQAARRVYERLSRLSDRELAARGLSRDDIRRLTLEALEGRTGA